MVAVRLLAVTKPCTSALADALMAAAMRPHELASEVA